MAINALDKPAPPTGILGDRTAVKGQGHDQVAAKACEKMRQETALPDACMLLGDMKGAHGRLVGENKVPKVEIGGGPLKHSDTSWSMAQETALKRIERKAHGHS